MMRFPHYGRNQRINEVKNKRVLFELQHKFVIADAIIYFTVLDEKIVERP
jgi:hypothetical protein